MINRENETIAEFIRENKDSDLVKLLIRANEQRDRETFVRLLQEIKETIALQYEIDYHEDQILEAKIRMITHGIS